MTQKKIKSLPSFKNVAEAQKFEFTFKRDASKRFLVALLSCPRLGGLEFQVVLAMVTHLTLVMYNPMLCGMLKLVFLVKINKFTSTFQLELSYSERMAIYLVIILDFREI